MAYNQITEPMYYKYGSDNSTVSVILDYFIHDTENIEIQTYARQLASKNNNNIYELSKVITTIFSYYLIIITIILIGLGIYLRKKNDKEASNNCFISSAILIIGSIAYFLIINLN